MGLVDGGGFDECWLDQQLVKACQPCQGLIDAPLRPVCVCVCVWKVREGVTGADMWLASYNYKWPLFPSSLLGNLIPGLNFYFWPSTSVYKYLYISKPPLSSHFSFLISHWDWYSSSYLYFNFSSSDHPPTEIYPTTYIHLFSDMRTSTLLVGLVSLAASSLG